MYSSGARGHESVDTGGQVDTEGCATWTAVRGRSVAISGDTIIVGAVGDDEHGEFTGSAYIFARHHGGPNTWGEVTKLRASNAARKGTSSERASQSVAIRLSLALRRIRRHFPPAPASQPSSSATVWASMYGARPRV